MMNDFTKYDAFVAESEAVANKIVNRLASGLEGNDKAHLMFSIASNLRKFYEAGKAGEINDIKY
jgi:hypothetical protein